MFTMDAIEAHPEGPVRVARHFDGGNKSMACALLRTCCLIDYLIPFARQLGGRYTLTACALRVTVRAGREKNVLLADMAGDTKQYAGRQSIQIRLTDY